MVGWKPQKTEHEKMDESADKDAQCVLDRAAHRLIDHRKHNGVIANKAPSRQPHLAHQKSSIFDPHVCVPGQPRAPATEKKDRVLFSRPLDTGIKSRKIIEN